MKIGILGGTFDPIHNAHLTLGREACRVFHLDHVLVMPTGNSYLKTTTSYVSPASVREDMVKLAIEGEEHFRYSDLEILRPGYTYTSDTLLTLSRRQPETEWYFIIGADSLHSMHYWYAPEIIFRYASIIVAGRGAQVSDELLLKDTKALEDRYNARIYLLPFENMDVSSSRIRREISEGKLPHPALPEAVNAYIRRQGLYQPLRESEICRRLAKRLKPSRYRHTLGVADTAERMARHYGTVEPLRARLAGLLHDCGKNEGDALTHAPIGAHIARNEFGVQDEEILSSIRFHTTGRPAMSDLEKIIFIADYIEPGRDRAPRLPFLRELAYRDMDETILCILQDTLAYLRDSGMVIDEHSVETYNYYNSMRKETSL